jgi:RNA-directed DNA polymerase
MHDCGTSRNGKVNLKRQTATKKYRSKVSDLKEWFRTKLTTPISEVWSSLASKLQGHFQYFHVKDTWQMLMKYRETVRRLGLRWMRRRSQKSSSLRLSDYRSYLETYPLPMPGRLTDLVAMTRAQ